MNWSDASLTQIIEHLEDNHKTMNEEIKRLRQLLAGALVNDKQKHGEMLNNLKQIFDYFEQDLERHFVREEDLLFPYIRKMENYQNRNGAKPLIPFKHIENPISQVEYDHDRLEHELLAKMRKETNNYQLPADASAELKGLYEGLNKLEAEIVEHRRLETNILFPKTINLELSIMHR